MEVFAGFLEHTDHHIGRLIEFLRSIGEFDNTLIMFISDNGASAEGGPTGSVNENKFFNNVPEDCEQNLAALDDIGGPKYFNHYSWGWTLRRQHAVPPLEARDLSRRLSDPFIVHWPKGIKAKGEIRHQYAHAIDMVPTVLEALGIEAPTQINGVTQSPIEGVQLRAHIRRREGAEQAHHAVLRDVRPPVDLSRRLARGVSVARHVVHGSQALFWQIDADRGQADRAGREALGALPRREGLRREPQPCRRQSRQADRDDRALVRRGRQVQRAADRQPRHAALRRRASAAHARTGKSYVYYPGTQTCRRTPRRRC